MRTLIAAVVAMIGLGVVGAGAAWVWLRTSLPDHDLAETVPGLAAPAEILWDERGVPHIWGASAEAAVFAQGWAHARDRLWQMELVRRAVQGRLAEVLGEPGLDTDRFMRRLGLWRAALQSEPLLSPTERRLLRAYAAGVNAALDTRHGALPPEFLALRYRPEPWRPEHSLAVAKMMSLTLAAYGESVAVARAIRTLGPERARHLFPAFPEWGATILPGPAPTDPPPLATALIDGYSIAAASNSWVVSGQRTRSGKPILANDPHLELQAPSLWYLVGLHAPAGEHGSALDVVGVSIPGAPLVILGHNRAIAWGMTNAYVDDVDLFLERVDDADPDRYLAPGRSLPFQVRRESIRVKGRDASEVLTVRSTRHGPVIPVAGADAAGADALNPGDTVLAVRWTALDPGTVFRGILGLNLAGGWDDFVAAVDAMDDPHQNLTYADTAGHIGYYMGGTVPLRGDRRPAPVAPVPGWSGEWDWRGVLPFDEHPHLLDPDAGFVVTANNRQTVEPIAELISQSWQQPFRAMRIAAMIDSARDLDADEIHAMQLDRTDLYALRYLDRAVSAARSAGLDDIAEALAGWDGVAAAASSVAAVFYVWNEMVRRAAARDLYGGEPGYFTREAAGDVLERRALPWADEPAAAYHRIAEAAIRQAVDVVGEDAWRHGNRAIHGHALGGVDLLDRVLGLNVGPVPHAGSPTTVNVAHWAFRSPADDYPFITTAGPSMRHVADMGNLDGAGGFVIGTGQSGIPFSHHYDDQVPLWANGGLLILPLRRDAAERRAVARTSLDPERGDER